MIRFVKFFCHSFQFDSMVNPLLLNSPSQVKVAYDVKLEELMNQGLEQEELTKKLDLLKVRIKTKKSQTRNAHQLFDKMSFVYVSGILHNLVFSRR